MKNPLPIKRSRLQVCLEPPVEQNHGGCHGIGEIAKPALGFADHIDQADLQAASHVFSIIDDAELHALHRLRIIHRACLYARQSSAAVIDCPGLPAEKIRGVVIDKSPLNAAVVVGVVQEQSQAESDAVAGGATDDTQRQRSLRVLAP